MTLREEEVMREVGLMAHEAFKKLDKARAKYARREYGINGYRSVVGRVRQKLARDIMDIWYRER